MKITINSPIRPDEDYQIWTDENKRLSKPKNTMFSHYWDEGDISMLLSETQYQKFEAGQYEFNIPTWKVRMIECRQLAKNNEQLKFISQFL